MPSFNTQARTQQAGSVRDDIGVTAGAEPAATHGKGWDIDLAGLPDYVGHWLIAFQVMSRP
jgi:hypothetical protein